MEPAAAESTGPSESGETLVSPPEQEAKAEGEKISKSLQSIGFSEADIAGLTDHRMLVLARKAMLYDKLVSAKSAKSKQIRTAPPVVRPGANVSSDQGKVNFVKARTEIRKAGQQGKTRVQEDIMVGLLNKAFK